MISRLKKEIQQVNHYLELLEGTGTEEEKNEIRYRLIARMEEMTIAARNQFPVQAYEYTFDHASNLEDMNRNEKCSVCYNVEDESLHLIIPRMIAWKRSDHRLVKAYYGRFRDEFLHIARLTRFQLPEQFVIWYRHNYKSSLRGINVLDHDNIETKIMTDLLCRCFGMDDSPMHCETYVSSIGKTEDCSEIFLIPKEKFIEFYRRKNTE